MKEGRFPVSDLNSRINQHECMSTCELLKLLLENRSMILQIWMFWIFLMFKVVDVLGEQLFIVKLVLSLRQMIVCENSVLCAKRQQSASKRTGIISNLRKGFEK